MNDGTAVKLWPPPDHLAEIAQDNTIFVTSTSCAYADLATNWIKHVHNLNINCFYVAAADRPTAGFLEDWLPSHTSQTPQEILNKVRGSGLDKLVQDNNKRKDCISSDAVAITNALIQQTKPSMIIPFALRTRLAIS